MGWPRLTESWRIFLAAWIVYSAHFATNVVREHYPAFSLAETATFRVDAYRGFHPDIFVHRDGHSYINNQVFVSALAAIPLAVFDPVLDALEARSRARIATSGVPDAEYRTDKPRRRDFFRLVRERGLDLRFGAATAVTTVFFMAPLTAAFLVFFHGVLRRRGVEAGTARALTLLLGFGTPLFFRATTLSHNMFVMFGMFGAFALLWQAGQSPIPASRRFWAGVLAGVTIATDYIGVVTLPLVYGYFIASRMRTAPLPAALRESALMACGTAIPIAFLWGSQWAMFGHPLYPAQYWMPIDQNVYTQEGMRGFGWPDFELLIENLFHPGYGLFVWMPIVLVAMVPARRYGADTLVLPRFERRFLVVSSVVLLLFCSMNQYARLQWNSGFRYLLPLVPLIVLALADHWMRMPRSARILIGGVAVLHAWVLTVFRDVSAWTSWQLFLTEGLQLPWLRVIRMTSDPQNVWAASWWLPACILAVTVLLAGLIWTARPRLPAQAIAAGPRVGR